ncbi:MAG TPA: hypothetical protein VFK06_15345 [Candidatus Angelobacter sp.]|nr:hypothetical protein [Candidatus Angelobacter sp.]
MWLLGGLRYIFFPINIHDPADRSGYIILGVAYIFSGFIHFWQALAKHRLSVSPEELTFERRAMGLHETKRYRLSEISNLRVDKRRIFTGRPWVAADYKGKRKFIGMQLISPVPQGLLDPIYARFPHIAPDLGTHSSLR